MRPDQTTADFSADFSRSGSAIPLTPPALGDDDGAKQDRQRPLTRITFCFAWLFGLEPFLLGATNEQSPSGANRRG
jgi:hypothetical protein